MSSRVLIFLNHNLVRRCLFVFVYAMFCISKLLAQFESFSQDWRWVNFTTESGLPSNQISDVVETHDGTVWAATSLGLAWFDGFQWHSVPDTNVAFKKRPQSIVPGHDSAIFAIFDNQVYGCTSKGIEPLDQNFEGKNISAVALVYNSHLGLMIQSSDGFLYIYRDSSLQRFKMPAQFSLYGGPQIFSSGEGENLWISTLKGLYRWNGIGWDLKLQTENNYFPIQSIVEQRNGTVFVSLSPIETRGLWQLKPDGTYNRVESEGKEIIRTTDITPSGEIIAVYESDDIRIYRNGSWSSLMYVPTQLRSVIFLRFRGNGDMWVGTETGLCLHKSSSQRWTYWKHPFPNLQNTVHEIIRTNDGSIWLGTESGIEIHHIDGSIVEISSINGNNINIVTGLCEDKIGDVWISSGGNFEGAYRWNGKRWDFFGPKQGLTGRFHRIKKDRLGRLWFLGLGETADGPQPGAWVYDGNKFTHWGTKEGLIHDRVYSFESASDGTLWFGTLKGISRWKNGMWTHWRSGSELIGTGIFTLALGPDGTLWFGDRGHGLGYIDTLDKPHYFTQSHGLVNNYVWDIKFDDRGTLWISTRGGVSSYSDGIWSTFSLSTGINSLRLWPILPVDNKVYVGTDGNGVDILRFDEATHPPPQIECGDPSISGDRVTMHWKCYAYWGEIQPDVIQTRYRIDNGEWLSWDVQRGLSVSGLGFGDHSIHFQAKDLFGKFDSTGQRKTFSITPPFYSRLSFALPIGFLLVVIIYLGVVLIIRKRNHSRALRESEMKLRMITDTTSSAIFIVGRGEIQFVNPVMESITGYTHAELMKIGLQGLIHPSQQDRLETLQAESSASAESSRKVELRIVRKDGEERWLDCIARRVTYEGKEALLGSAFDITDRKYAESQLIAYQEQLRSLASELSSTEDRERRQMASYLHDTIAQALAFSKIKLETLMDTISPSQYDGLLAEIHHFINQSIENTQSLTFELSPPILYELSLEEALHWLADHMREQHQLTVQFYNDGQNKPVGDEVKIVLFHVVRELLTNVIKHAHAHVAHLKISRSEHEMQIIIEDDGDGFNTEILSAGGIKSARFGLFHIRERLTSIGTRFEISSEPGQGTYVLISVPLL